jgi:hypothetical protein
MVKAGAPKCWATMEVAFEKDSGQQQTLAWSL